MKTDVTSKNLELYLHIPFCQRKCRYCDFLSFDKMSESEAPYVGALIKQIDFYARLYGDRPVTSVYIGGGTPSWLGKGQIYDICKAVTDGFNLVPDAEFCIEVNPGTISAQKAAEYRSAGINRISIGLQSVNDDELEELGRIHTYSQFLSTLDIFIKEGFNNINVDIMTGLPHQTRDKLLYTLRQILMFRPKHISAYSLMVEEGTPFMEKYAQDVENRRNGRPTQVLPDEDTEYELGELVRTTLLDSGYEQYEISNFARPNGRCRHNIGYWDRTEYVGMGLGAASLVNETRFSVTRNMDDYIKKIADGDFNGVLEGIQVLSRKEQMSEFMFLGLRMTDGVSAFDFQKNFGTAIDAVYGSVIKELESKELLEQKDGRVRLTKKGLDLGNICMAQFLL